MSTNTFTRMFTAAVILSILFPVPILADVFMKQKCHDDGFTAMGQTQPPKDFIQTQWMTEDKSRSDMDEQSVIVRLDKNRTIILDHTKKTYMEMRLDFESAADGDKDSAGKPSYMEKLIQDAFKIDFTVSETNERKKINKWDCQKYIEKIDSPAIPSESVIWASQDIKVDEKALAKFNTAYVTMHPSRKQFMGKILKQMEKIKGVPVLILTTMTYENIKQKSSLELLEVKTDVTAPAGIFDVPAGYKKSTSSEVIIRVK